MKVAILQDYLRCGGTENQSVFLHTYLNNNGIDTHLLTIQAGGSLESRIQFCDKHLCLDSKTNWFAPSLISRMRSLKPNIILLMGRIANMYGWLLKEKLEPNTVIITTMRSGRALPYFYRKSLERSDLTLVNSHFAKNLLDSQKIQSSPVQVIHNAFLYETPKLKQKNEESKFIILNLAAFVPGKNHKEWLNIAKILTYKMNASFEVWFLGEGTEREAFERAVKQQKMEHCLKIFGFQDNPNLFYQDADIAVSVSLEESLPNFLVESQFHGLPVVSYDTAGCKECFEDEESGFLVKSGSVNELCNKIIQLQESTVLRDVMSRSARKFAMEHFSASEIGDRFTKVLNRLHRKQTLLNKQKAI